MSVAVSVGVFLATCLGVCRPAAAQDIAGLWVREASLVSSAAIRQLVEDASIAGFTTLLVQVLDLALEHDRPPRSRRAPRVAEPADRWHVLLSEARRRRLEVHAWVDVTRVRVSNASAPDRIPVTRQHPEWLMVPRALATRLARLDLRDPARLAALVGWTSESPERTESLHVSPILPAVADHLDAQLTRLLSRYAFDGIHLDGVQFPSSDFDYGPAAVAAFRVDIAASLTDARRRDLDTRAAIDPLTYPDAFPSEWSRFRRSTMTALVARLGNTVRQARRSVRVSVSVVADHDEALGQRLQDWRTWVENGFVDVLCLRPGIETTEDFERQVRAARQFSSGADLWVGIAAGQLPAADSVDRIRAARRLGVAGVVISAHDTVTDRARMPPDHLQHLGRALSAPPTP
ncbi:MAG: family 10 glycosylhydrolase [Acidobacteria bacterium]|nr:family 10 glycosylhydrolase [Acidobacteriota bacterium]